MYNTSDVLPEFSAQEVTLQVLDRLERRRAQLAADPAAVDAEVGEALATVEKSYREAELPAAYFDSLQREVRAIVPAEWRRVAQPYTQREAADFGVWRGGDVVARLTYIFVALCIGGLMVWAPFIPIWEKWFPFVLGASAWWLPDAQVAWHKRRYARALGGIARRMGELQPRLEGMVTTEELLLPEKGTQK
jgi:hypothetical protein